MDDLSEDKVWFVANPDDERGEIISRMRLPDNAVRLSIEYDGSRNAEADDRMYEVWVPLDEEDLDEE